MNKKDDSLLNDIESFPTPQYPLPDEIARLDKTDTVCQYCGISYFILHEIKQLKIELMSAKNEISDLKAFREMYSELLQKWQSHVDLTEITQSLLKEKDAQISTLEQENKVLKTDNYRISELSKSLENSQNQAELLRVSYAKIFQKMRAFNEFLNKLKSMVVNNYSLMTSSLANVKSNMEQEIKKAFDANEKHYRNELVRQKRETTDKMHQQEAEWKLLEIRLRDAHATAVQDVTRLKSQLLNVSDETNMKLNENTRLERENSDFLRQIEAMKNSISILEASLAAEKQRYIELRNIVDQCSEDNNLLNACTQRQQSELASCRSALSEAESKAKREREELTEQFSQKLKMIEIQMQNDIEKVQTDANNKFESNQDRLKQNMRRENEARITAIQENFSNERNKFEAKCSRLMADLERCQHEKDEFARNKEIAENKVVELESRVKKLEGLLRQVHEEKLEETNRALGAEQEISMLHSVIENNITERGRITNALNMIKQEIIKAKLPQEVFEELIRQVPESWNQPNFVSRSQIRPTNEHTDSRMRAWSLDSQSNSNSLIAGSISINENNEQKQFSADGGLHSQHSALMLAKVAEKAEKLKALTVQQQQHGSTINLPPLGPSKSSSSLFDGTASVASSSSPLGLYQRNEVTSLINNQNIQDNSILAVPFRLNPSNNSNRTMPARHSLLESNFGNQQRPPIGKLSAAADMRLKIAAILSRK